MDFLWNILTDQENREGETNVPCANAVDFRGETFDSLANYFEIAHDAV